MKALLLFIVGIGCAIIQALTAGFVLSKYWAWFIQPLFTGAPALTYLQGVGMQMTVNLFLLGLYTTGQKTKEDEERPLHTALARCMGMTLFGYPLLLLMGYIWSCYL